MKVYYLIGLVLIVLLSSCENSKEKREIEKKNREIKAQQQKVQKIKDSIKFTNAIALYDKQDWDSALVAFKNVKYSNFYGKQSQNYIEKIRNRPWQESYSYIRESVEGKFSNSATKDSQLWVEIQINKKSYVYLYLYEYSNSKPSNRTAEKPMYDFSLYVSGYKNEYLCYEIRPNDSYEVGDATHSEGIRLSGGLAKKVINILKKSNGEVYFSLTMGSSSTYNFYLSSDGFTKAYNSL
ncbi:MAG: hypothetical protein K8R58_09410 [Bacteroidales bacterium]|nr:hypothetical protein [Bacteroidales bacterium]